MIAISENAESPIVYLDSNVFIDAFEREPRHNPLNHLFDALRRYQGRAATSEYTFGELLGRTGSFASWADQKAFYKGLLFDATFVRLVPVGRQILEQSENLRFAARQTTRSLRLADAVHIATAIFAGCTSFLTSDARLRSAIEPPLRAVTPTEADITTLIEALDA